MDLCGLFDFNTSLQTTHGLSSYLGISPHVGTVEHVMSSSRSFRSLHLDSLSPHLSNCSTNQKIQDTEYPEHQTCLLYYLMYNYAYIIYIYVYIYIRTGCAIIHLCVSFQVIQISHPFRQACKCCGHVLEHRTRG